MDGRHAANAGAICCWRPWMADMQQMQEQFAAVRLAAGSRGAVVDIHRVLYDPIAESHADGIGRRVPGIEAEVRALHPAIEQVLAEGRDRCRRVTALAKRRRRVD